MCNEKTIKSETFPRIEKTTQYKYNFVVKVSNTYEVFYHDLEDAEECLKRTQEDYIWAKKLVAGLKN